MKGGTYKKTEIQNGRDQTRKKERKEEQRQKGKKQDSHRDITKSCHEDSKRETT